MLAVTGATGQIGSRVAARLSNLGFQQRLIVRDPARAPRLPGAEIMRASSYGNELEMRRALDAMDTLFLVSARDRFGVAHLSAKNGTEPPLYDRLKEQTTAIDAAIAAGVQNIVYLSIMKAAPDATFILAHDHFHTEQYIRNSGIPFTFLRAGLYTDNVPQCVSIGDVIRVPSGNGSVAWVTRDDIADAAVAVLTETGRHAGCVYDVTGPEALTMHETASILSDAIGRRIVYHPQSPEESRTARNTSRMDAFEKERRMLTGRGLDDYEVEVFVTHFLQIAEGDLAQVSPTVPDLTGHAAQSLSEYLQLHPESYQHLL